VSAPLAVVLDGRPVPSDQPAFTPTERGLLYGDGLFETFAVRDGVPVDADRHFARLRESCRALGFPEPHSWDGALALCLDAAGPGSRALRVTWTRGAASARSYLPTSLDGPPRMLVAAYGAPADRAAGVRAALVRDLAAGELARHKTTSALYRVVALTRAREHGAEEALLLDFDGALLEASVANVFVVFGERVVTPPLARPILPGLTRADVIARHGVEERDVSTEELARADEVVLTSSLQPAVPVLAIDGQPVGDGRPGPFARRLLQS
jgi:branched-subunit amino acid aminotransferase/4-amino-4-deoxychorismate lyase